MRSGILRDRVRIEQPVRDLDDAGAARTSWAVIAERNAQIMALRGNENFGADTDVAGADFRIRMRALPDHADFDPSWRLIDVDRGHEFDVVAIIPTRTRADLTILCKRGGARRSQ